MWMTSLQVVRFSFTSSPVASEVIVSATVMLPGSSERSSPIPAPASPANAIRRKTAEAPKAAQNLFGTRSRRQRPAFHCA